VVRPVRPRPPPAQGSWGRADRPSPAAAVAAGFPVKAMTGDASSRDAGRSALEIGPEPGVQSDGTPFEQWKPVPGACPSKRSAEQIKLMENWRQRPALPSPGIPAATIGSRQQSGAIGSAPAQASSQAGGQGITGTRPSDRGNQPFASVVEQGTAFHLTAIGSIQTVRRAPGTRQNRPAGRGRRIARAACARHGRTFPIIKSHQAAPGSWRFGGQGAPEGAAGCHGFAAALIGGAPVDSLEPFGSKPTRASQAAPNLAPWFLAPGPAPLTRACYLVIAGVIAASGKPGRLSADSAAVWSQLGADSDQRPHMGRKQDHVRYSLTPAPTAWPRWLGSSWPPFTAPHTHALPARRHPPQPRFGHQPPC